MTALPLAATVAVIGAGAMGAGIAQVAAAAGHPVMLFDAQPGAAQNGRDRIAKGLQALVSRGRMGQGDADSLVDRIVVAASIDELASAALVIEAIVEDLAIKQDLFVKLEAIVGPGAILATNTSSISITAIGRPLARPERLAGLHFFNPAPVMKLVEIVVGLATDPQVAETLFATATGWGKKAVHAKSTPGFIVNRVARAYYAEPLRLCEEQVADPATLDALLTEGGGFRMGPFALMDLIGHDVNYAVSLSVYNAYYQEPRFRPSIAQLELISAGRLGRKTGRGFFDYSDGVPSPEPASLPCRDTTQAADNFDFRTGGQVQEVHTVPTDGRLAASLADERGAPVIVYDLTADSGASRLGFTISPGVSEEALSSFVATALAAGLKVTQLPDWPGLVVMRTVALLANEAFEAVLQGVANEGAIDDAMRYGVNYPRGPIEWARSIGLPRVVNVLDTIHQLTGDPRYRCSLALRLAAKA